MIGIIADFDPVHKGHEELIKQAKKIAEEKDTELALYLNNTTDLYYHTAFQSGFQRCMKMELPIMLPQQTYQWTR